MTAAVIRRARAPIAFEERRVPDPGPGQVRVRVEACGVCAGDLQIQEGLFDFAKLPVVPGHEVVGRVDAIAPDVSAWVPGDRVGVPWIWSTCGVCDACVAGDEPGCARQQACGVTVDGGYAPYLVAPAAFVTRVPDELSSTEAAPLFCAGLTTYAGLQAAGVTAGMSRMATQSVLVWSTSRETSATGSTPMPRSRGSGASSVMSLTNAASRLHAEDAANKATKIIVQGTRF